MHVFACKIHAHQFTLLIGSETITSFDGAATGGALPNRLADCRQGSLNGLNAGNIAKEIWAKKICAKSLDGRARRWCWGRKFRLRCQRRAKPESARRRRRLRLVSGRWSGEWLILVGRHQKPAQSRDQAVNTVLFRAKRAGIICRPLSLSTITYMSCTCWIERICGRPLRLPDAVCVR